MDCIYVMTVNANHEPIDQPGVPVNVRVPVAGSLSTHAIALQSYPKLSHLFLDHIYIG